MAPRFADVYREKYLLLTTFTKDGGPAWWFVPQSIIRGGIDKLHSAIEVKAGEAR